MLLGVYFLGQNIYFTNNVYPYWWRGVAADTSILFLTAEVLMFFVLPRAIKSWAGIAIAIGIVAVFFSSKAILQPTSLWQFVSLFFPWLVLQGDISYLRQEGLISKKKRGQVLIL